MQKSTAHAADRLAALEDRHAHEIMGEGERCELYARIVKLRDSVEA